MPFNDWALKSLWAALLAFPVAFLVWLGASGVPCAETVGDVIGTQAPGYPVDPPTTADGCLTYGSFMGFPANVAWLYWGGLAGFIGWGLEMLHKLWKYVNGGSESTISS